MTDTEKSDIAHEMVLIGGRLETCSTMFLEDPKTVACALRQYARRLDRVAQALEKET